jgi:hypothetical protein
MNSIPDSLPNRAICSSRSGISRSPGAAGAPGQARAEFGDHLPELDVLRLDGLEVLDLAGQSGQLSLVDLDPGGLRRVDELPEQPADQDENDTKHDPPLLERYLLELFDDRCHVPRRLPR